MTRYFSRSTGYFYELDTHGDMIPLDAVEITAVEHVALLAAQRSGKVITADENGRPAAIDPPLTLAERRVSAAASINTERDRREELGFPYRGKWLDSTPRSVQRITAAALAAQAVLATGQPYSVDWTCADNSTLILDAAGVIGIPVALAQHAAALHDHARSLKAAVYAADSEAALAAIDIQAGWPGGAE